MTIQLVLATAFALMSMANNSSVAAECAQEGMMKSVKITSFNPEDPLSTLEVMQVPIPKPASGQLLIHMRAMPINPADYFSIMGLYPGYQPESLPHTPGLEGCGVVAEIGHSTDIPEDLAGLSVGTRVVPTIMQDISNTGGSWSEYILVNVGDVVLTADNVSDEAAAQLVVNPLTVIGMLDKLSEPHSQNYILQSAGGSTLGKQLIQIANATGRKTISTVRRCEQVDELKAYGAQHVICTSDGSGVADAVMEITNGEGAWGAVDAVAGEMTAKLQESVRQGGKVLVYGALAGFHFTGSVGASIFRNVAIEGYWVTSDIILSSTPEKRREYMRQAMSYMADKVVVPHVGETYPIDDVKQAIEEANKPGRSSNGKVLLVTDSSCASKYYSDEL